ncbi:MAG: hypothetical protein ACKVWR_21840 [Acidimicrobiales bacterium]
MSARPLADEVAGYLAGRGERPWREIARAISAADIAVLDALNSDPRFYSAEETLAGSRVRKVWGVRQPARTAPSAPAAARTPQNTKRVTHADRLLAVLSDGEWHSHRDLYRLGLIVHSRASDLRARGYRVEMRRDGDDYLYRLADAAVGAVA